MPATTAAGLSRTTSSIMLTVDPQSTFRQFVDLIAPLPKPRRPTSNPNLPSALTLLAAASQPKALLPDRPPTSLATRDAKAQTPLTFDPLAAQVKPNKTLTTTTLRLLQTLPRLLEVLP